jgi:hypothetical protein
MKHLAIILWMGIQCIAATALAANTVNSPTVNGGTRTYWAACAGLEWGIGSVNLSAVCPTSPTTLATTFDGGFTVVVTCTPQTYVEAGVNIRFTSLASSAGATGSVGFIERNRSASVERN